MKKEVNRRERNLIRYKFRICLTHLVSLDLCEKMDNIQS